MADKEPNGWNEYKRLVIHRLDKLSRSFVETNTKLDHLTRKVTVLETKAIIFGGIAALIVSAAVQIVIKLT